MGVADTVAGIDRELRAAGTAERAVNEKAYLKSALEHYGTPVPAIRAVAKRFHRQHPDLPHRELVELIDALWRTPVHERRMIVVELLARYQQQLGTNDVELIERLLRESKTWALVDSLAASIMGPIVERDHLGAILDRWSQDEDFWIRRSALLALLGGLRSGGGDFARFSRYADAMLDEKEFFIRKAIGWVLRDTARKRPDLVYEWLLPRSARASGVTVREALKPLSPEQRSAILAAR